MQLTAFKATKRHDYGQRLVSHYSIKSVFETDLARRVGFGWSFVLQSYGSEWRDGRKAFQHAFHPQTVAKYRSAEIRAGHALLKNLLKNPDGFFSQLRL